MSYLGTPPNEDIVSNVKEYVATAGQTVFEVIYDNYAEVSLNGTQLASSDYTMNNGISITLAVGATAGDIVQCTGYESFKYNNTVDTSTAQIVSGVKTFTSSPVIPDAVNADEALSKGQLLTEMKTVDGAGSGLDADLLDGYNLDQNGIPLLRGYQANGKIVNDNTDLNTISVNSTHNIDSTNTLNSPESTWGFVTTYIHSNFNATNAWRTQVFIGMQSDSMFVRRGNPDGTWTAWVRKTTVNDLLGVNQTWQDVTASRAFGVTYTNTTGKPIELKISTSSGSGGGSYIAINGVNVFFWSGYSITNMTGSIIVPAGATYNLAGTGTLSKWQELR